MGFPMRWLMNGEMIMGSIVPKIASPKRILEEVTLTLHSQPGPSSVPSVRHVGKSVLFHEFSRLIRESTAVASTDGGSDRELLCKRTRLS